MRESTMQVVVLCGGLGTRLGPLTAETPKSMIKVLDKPFITHQLGLLSRRLVTDVVLCTGHFSQQIKRYCDEIVGAGITIRYSDEKEQLLGTGGALKNAEHLLEDQFFVMYGDSYLPMDFVGAMDQFDRSNIPAMMVVYHNQDKFDRSNVILEDGRVEVYDKSNHHPKMEYIDAGVAILKKEVLSHVPEKSAYSLETLYQGLVARHQMAAYETMDRFYEIGSNEGLEEFRRLIITGDLPA